MNGANITETPLGLRKSSNLLFVLSEYLNGLSTRLKYEYII